MKKHWSRLGVVTSLCLVGSFSWAQAAPVDGTAVATENFAELNGEGQAAILRHDYVAAEGYFREAREAALQCERLDLVTEMDARRAARYINEGEASRALFILEPYIKPGVNKFMLADYLMALRLCNQPKKVISVYQEYVPDPQEFPSYGLQTVGDVCLHQGKYRQAIKAYEEVLKRDQPEQVPYVQLGYAYCLGRLDKKAEALAAYEKVANLNDRLNNFICMDGEGFLAMGRVNLARRMFALLGKDEKEREKYSLRYAQALVEANKDFQDQTMNFRRDEILANRSYEHEADKLLRKLEQSEDEDVANEARTARAANLLHEELYADSRRKLAEAMEEDTADMAAQAAYGEYERTKFNSLSAVYENNVDNKRNHQQSAGLSYDGYLGANFFLEGGFARKWMSDDVIRESFWQSNLGLRKQFENWSLKGEWLGYCSTEAKNGFGVALSYDFNDVTKLTYGMGRRLHEHAAAVRAGIREDYHEVALSHQLNHLTSLEGSYNWSKMTDDNKYKGYSLALSHLLRVKHNFSDRLMLSYEHSGYDFAAAYDSPLRRVDYGLTFTRKWNLPKQNATLAWQTGLSWGKDDDERTEFVPSVGLNYVREFPHNQQLQVGAIYYRYFNQVNEGINRRKDGCSLNVSYNWRW